MSYFIRITQVLSEILPKTFWSLFFRTHCSFVNVFLATSRTDVTDSMRFNCPTNGVDATLLANDVTLIIMQTTLLLAPPTYLAYLIGYTHPRSPEVRSVNVIIGRMTPTPCANNFRWSCCQCHLVAEL